MSCYFPLLFRFACKLKAACYREAWCLISSIFTRQKGREACGGWVLLLCLIFHFGGEIFKCVAIGCMNYSVAFMLFKCNTFIGFALKLWCLHCFQGVIPTAQRAAIVVGVELPVYDITKKHLIHSGLMGDTVLTHFMWASVPVHAVSIQNCIYLFMRHKLWL